MVPLVNRMVAESAALRGPYTMAGKVTRIANVGGTGQIRFTVLAAARKPIAGLPLTITLGNALPARALPRATAANGTATVDLVPSAPGAVTATATGGLIQWSTARRPRRSTSPSTAPAPDGSPRPCGTTTSAAASR